MKARTVRHLAGEARRLVREESGVALMLTLAVFLLLYVLCCGVYATGETVRQRIEVQNACDAAAYSAAVVQADALSRMAVVNRAMAWTYIQLCREEMDYIVFSWLRLTCQRFRWDEENKAIPGDIGSKRHFTFEGFPYNIGSPSFAGAGLHCHDPKCTHDHDAWYCGVSDGTSEPKKDHVLLNGETDIGKATPVKEIEDALEELDEMAGATDRSADDGSLHVERDSPWKTMMANRILWHKTLIESMNATLVQINGDLHTNLEAAVEYVLFHNLPKDSKGQLSVEDAEDFEWAMHGGLGPMPEAYSGTPKGEADDPSGSYFSGLGNTEGDELQFLTMADGIPGRREGAPGWMEGRPVRLSDYFGFGQDEKLTQEDSDGEKIYVAGGLDQWYVRGTAKEAESGELNVEKEFRPADAPGGIMRVYKHTNREEGATDKAGLKFHRPNHVFSVNPELSNIVNWMDIQTSFGQFGSPFGSRVPRRVRDFVNQVLQATMGKLTQALGGVGGVIGQLGQLQEQFSKDILPSDRHLPEDFPDQCLHVSPSTGLVAQYEWSSAYWISPWFRVPLPYGLKPVYLGCWRLPVSALTGCDEHGYKPWLKELDHLRPRQGRHAGATRAEYQSCFINFDDTQNMNKNHYLKGYARVYGDDADIFDPLCYEGALARPWVLSEAFFKGDGTILVGLARKQKNPFLKLAGGVSQGGLYEPFSPRPGADRYLVGLSAARAAWAPRPDKPVTGMESMNGTGTPKAPGNYEPRFDGVTEHVFGFQCACGKAETQDRLLRMWNLSQTDWDGTLLPLRHAYDAHSPYDSYKDLTDGSFWEYQDDRTNAVQRLAAHVQSMAWNSGLLLVAAEQSGQVAGNAELMEKVRKSPTKNTSDILPYPLYGMFLHRRLL